MKKDLIITIITSLILLFLGLQNSVINLSLFVFLIYTVSLSFLSYRSLDKRNIYHMSYMAICLSLLLNTNEFSYQLIALMLFPMSLIIDNFKEKTQTVFRIIQGGNLVVFGGALFCFYNQMEKMAAILAVLGVLIRSMQFPFHLWLREVSTNKNLFPSYLFFTISQTGFIFFAKNFLNTLDFANFNFFITGITLCSGLYLSALSLRNNKLLTKHLGIIISQSCLPLAAYHSYTTSSATGGIIFSLVLAFSGSLFGLIAFVISEQKNITVLDKFYCLYEKNKDLAIVYLISGLSFVGLPFTIGYFAEDILFHGLVESAPILAPLYILMTAINAYGIFQSFNLVFFGHSTTKYSSVYINSLNSILMKFAILVLVASSFFINPLAKKIEYRLKHNSIARVLYSK